ncbi:hypothetical protein HNV27_20920 [Myxococcus xanthus]|nr:hypothetical protein [Myxococcus xanthus]
MELHGPAHASPGGKLKPRGAPDMTYEDRIEQQLLDARRELEQADKDLATGTEAARVRYARALHEADIAERRALRHAREARNHQKSWRLVAG